MSKLDKLIKKLLRAPSQIRFDELTTVLVSHGYEVVRKRGSHYMFLHPEIRDVITVPYKRPHVKTWYVKHIVERLGLEDEE